MIPHAIGGRSGCRDERTVWCSCRQRKRTRAGSRSATTSMKRGKEGIMNTRSAPELPAIKVNRWFLSLGAGIITAVIACVVVAQVWAYVQTATRATAIADRQQTKRSELSQARARWDARPLASYRLLIQLGAAEGEISLPRQSVLSNTTMRSRHARDLEGWRY
jgi:hypothetical protein